MRHHIVPALLGALLMVAAACGDDDDDATVTTSAAVVTTAQSTAEPAATSEPVVTNEPASAEPTATGPAGASGEPFVADLEDAEYCAAVEEINNTDAMPTVEQIRAYLEVAPPELAEPVQVVIDALEAADGDFMAVFADEEAGAALEQITAVEAERCGTGDDGPPQDPMVTVIDETATRVDLVASEYAFGGALPSSPGRYSFVMANEGEEPHIMILLRLADGAVLDEVLTSQGDEGVAEQYESSSAMPGAEGVLSADLGAGNWVMLCPIPGPSGAPHFVDGMIQEFTIG